MNYYYIKDGITNGPIPIEDIINICDEETMICVEDGKVSDWKAAKLYPEYVALKADSSKNNESNQIPPIPKSTKRIPPPIIPKNNTNTKYSLLSKNIVLFILSNKILSSAIGLLLIYILYNVSISGKSNINSSLQNNLANLTGEWGWHDKKQEDNFWLTICFNQNSNTGTYKIQNKLDDWGGKKNTLNTISSGSFSLGEGHDRYGDKAYVATDISTSNPVFAVTQIENKYAIDWMLCLSMIEDDMFGYGMSKLSNNCNN
ncbi:MAG: hypothetical protein K9G64_08575 [Bacteroidia bacterium]|nr:hypothetical protein [Bacteroidia bacterium]